MREEKIRKGEQGKVIHREQRRRKKCRLREGEKTQFEKTEKEIEKTEERTQKMAYK